MKKDVIRRVISKMMILTAVGLLCLPAVFHIRNAVKAVRVSDSYGVSADREEEYADVLEAARQYNDSLVDVALHNLSDEEMEPAACMDCRMP